MQQQFSSRILKQLSKAGWTPQRDAKGLEDSFAKFLGDRWVPAAGPFLRTMGGLEIHAKLWVWDGPEWSEKLEIFAQRIEAVVDCKAVPVAHSYYRGDDCRVWIDERGRFYAVASEGMTFVGENLHDAVGVLLGECPLPVPPADIADSLEAVDWWDVDVRWLDATRGQAEGD